MKRRTPYLGTCTAGEYMECMATFTVPDPRERVLLQEGRVGLVLVPESSFRYSPDPVYAFEVAALRESLGRRLLCIRIDSLDPRDLRSGALDHCIPLRREPQSTGERLRQRIPFGGGWSHAREEALLVFPEEWARWFRGLRSGVAFSNPGVRGACFLEFGDRERQGLRAFLG
jgi:hypothetical protein